MGLNKQMSSTLPITPEVNSDIIRFKSIESKLSENHHLMSRKTDFLLCPICQEGNLNTYERGKILGIIPDKWLICNKCAAEFDKKFNKAQLVKVISDPFDIFKQFSLQTLSIAKWQDIAFQRIKSENIDLGEELLVLKTKLVQFVTNELIEGKFKAICINVNSFILKKDENPLFATVAVILEERKGRITERTTFGGGRRNYSGFSFRVAKGLYYHAGASTATPRQTTVQTTEYTELVNVDMGEFLVTNHRILFKGKSRGLVIPVSKIVAIDIDTENDAIMIIQENKKPSILKLAKDFNMELSGVKFDLPLSLDYVVSLINPTLCEQPIKVPAKPITTGNINYKNHIAPEYNNRVEKLKKSFPAAYNFLKYPEKNHTAKIGRAHV